MGIIANACLPALCSRQEEQVKNKSDKKKAARTQIKDLSHVRTLTAEELTKVAGGEHACGSESGGGIDDCGYPICY
jgi:hypothetical protein